MPKLSDLPLYDSEQLKTGQLERRYYEQFKAYCKMCGQYVTDWTDYDSALIEFEQHQRTCNATRN